MDHDQQNRCALGSLGGGTPVAAEVMGVCFLTSILDLFLHESLSVKNINECIDTILKNR